MFAAKRRNENNGSAPEGRGRRGASGKKGRSALRYAVLALCVCVMLVSGYKLIDSMLEYKKADDAYGYIEREFVKPPPNVSLPGETAPPEPSSLAPETTPPAVAVPPGETASEESAKPSYVDNPAPDYWPEVDFEGLSGVNSDFAAWLLCTGTNVNYPVVHGADNTYYLTHLFDHRQNGAGTLFVDYRNKRGFSDRNTIIYGHNMRNHSMFWTLSLYRNQSFYNAHPAFRLLTTDGNYEIRLFAGYVAATSNEAWRVYFSSDDDFLEWIASLKAGSAFSADVPVGADDRVVTLSTCVYDFNDARYVLFGKLVPVAGSEDAAPVAGSEDAVPVAGNEEAAP
ncbi:MAG: class B sortase [Oscillospiraceae bacterium]|jgi:sortase B|nr:class B sortase [Oscillospiraceae bacterium]